jgi:hypothetical protein
VLDSMWMLFLMTLTLLSLSSIYVISKFPITRAQHAARLAELAKKGIEAPAI